MLVRKNAPIEGYSAVPVGTLRQRVRVLDAEGMRQLIASEEFLELVAKRSRGAS